MISISDLYKLVYFSGIIVWILPAIRQYKTEFFDFFLILALIDPVAVVYGYFAKASIPLWLTTLFAYLLIISLLSEDNIKKLRYILILIPIVFMISIPLIQREYFLYLIITENIIIFIFFLKFLITHYVNHQKINLFYFMLCFYELTVILKLSNLIIGFSNAILFYFFTGIAQIIFGFFFSIVREDESTVIV
ncbi:MAG: hypothetical protein N2321_10205 [Melioribacteraceae bacterium]|nr:hypothetical protein [Melioribacteraceae bacterium]